MRPHGNANINPNAPRALGVCQRCGFLYNTRDLAWQWDWQFGPRLRNLGIQVCDSCLDVPQESGRTIILPADPVAVDNVLPEDYAAADNPLSTLGWNAANSFLPPLPLQSLGANIGNMTLNGGVNAAFDGIAGKRAYSCAALSISNSSFQNTVGKNWNANPAAPLSLPSTVAVQTHAISSVTLYAPSDAKFLNSATGVTGYRIDGSANNATWTTIISGTTAGTVGESITASTTSAAFYQYHRAVIQGDGFSTVAIAQAVFNVSDSAPNDI